MPTHTLAEHLQVLREAIRPIDTRPIWEIADGRYGMDRTRPPGERWHVVSCPWSKKILDDWQSPKVQEVVVRAGSQTWKTGIFLIALAWSVKHRPVPKLWLSADDSLARDISQDRIWPTLERSPDLVDLLLDNRNDKTLYKIRTKLCTIDVSGAESSTSLEQNPYGEILADECRQYQPGRLQKIKMRQRSYRDAKRGLFSTPDLVGDEFDQRCNLGSNCEWLFPCEHCEDAIPLVWSSKYSRLPDEYRGRSQMVFTKGGSEVWLECHCNHRHLDAPKTRRWILDRGVWVAMNTATDPELRDPLTESYHWPAMLNPRVVWYDMVKIFRQSLVLMNAGNVEDLKVFVNESLGEPWREGQHIEDTEVVKASYRIEMVNVTGSDWKYVFQTNDVGKYDFWHILRGWNPGAQTRILSAGQLRYWEDVRTIARRFGLTMTGRTDEGLAEGLCRRVFIDARYEDPASQEVHREAAIQGWTCLIGVDKKYFELKDEKKKTVQRLLYSEPRFYDSKTGVGATEGIKGIEFSIATDTAQDILDELLAQKVGKLDIPEDFEINDDNLQIKFSEQMYRQHMRNEPKIPQVSPKTGRIEWFRKRSGQQGLRDCEVYQVVAASMVKLIGALPMIDEKKK